MQPNMYFGGGAGDSTMTPVVLFATILAAILVLVLPRKYVPAPILALTFLTPFGEQLKLGGFHFYVLRILVICGIIRLLATGLFSSKPLFGRELNNLDKTFCWWSFASGNIFLIFNHWVGGAVVAQSALWLDAFGTYFLFLHLIQSREDIVRLLKVFAAVASLLALCMSFEFMTRVNLFSYISGTPIIPWLRNDNVRAQGTFSNSITAGVFGASLVPLFYWLWRGEKARLWAVTGILAGTTISLTSLASTAVTGYLAGIIVLCLWPIRKRMRLVRWGIVFMIIALAMVMKAPVWYLMARVNVAGGNAWDRAYLVDQAFRHLSSWWLLGTDTNASWGDFTWDACNQFIAEGFNGGILGLILFLAVLRTGFSRVGQCRKQAEGEPQEWFFWCLGAALFAQVIIFLGIDYFDQTRILWFIFLAVISTGTMATAPVVVPVPEPLVWRNPTAKATAPALGAQRSSLRLR